MLRHITLYAATALVLAALPLRAAPEDVRRAESPDAVRRCEPLGAIKAELTRWAGDYRVKVEQGYPDALIQGAVYRRDVLADARRKADALGGDRILPRGPFRDGSQTWEVYRCG